MSITCLKTVFLALFLLAHARPQTGLRVGPWAIGARNDWVSSGNYLVYSCSSQASEVVEILDQTYMSLQVANQSTDSPAYKAFFRSANPDSMTAVLRAMAAGTNITTELDGSRRPMMVCVNAVDTRIRTFWDLCHQSPTTVLLQPPETAVFFLCPLFFNQERVPQSTDCGTVNHASTKLIERGWIAASQYSFLVQALAEVYIRQAKTGTNAVRGRAPRDQNTCLALPPDQALTSPDSYMYYASSK